MNLIVFNSLSLLFLLGCVIFSIFWPNNIFAQIILDVVLDVISSSFTFFCLSVFPIFVFDFLAGLFVICLTITHYDSFLIYQLLRSCGKFVLVVEKVENKIVIELFSFFSAVLSNIN